MEKIVRDNVRYIHKKVNLKDKHCAVLYLLCFVKKKHRQTDYYSSCVENVRKLIPSENGISSV